MKNVNKYIFTIALVFFTYTHAHAAVTYTDPEKVKSLATYALGNIGVAMNSSSIKNPAECPHTNSYNLYKISDTTEHGKNMYAMVLAAKATQNNIRLLIDNGTCVGGYAVINGIISM